jgi:hypothetical protein
MQKFPATAGELVRALDDLIPEVISKPGDTPETIFFATGRRSVVHFLKQWRDGALSPAPTARQRGEGRPTR